MKKFESFEAHEIATADGVKENTLYVVYDGNWVRADMVVDKDMKDLTLVKKFAKAIAKIQELDGWGEGMVESCENGYTCLEEKGFFRHGVEDNYIWLAVKVK